MHAMHSHQPHDAHQQLPGARHRPHHARTGQRRRAPLRKPAADRAASPVAARRARRRRAPRSPRPVAPGDRRRPADHRTAEPNHDRPPPATSTATCGSSPAPTPAGRLIEIRSATPHGGMRQTFTPATRTDLAARTITTLATRTDVYVGVLLRRRRAGGRHACERSHLAFIEIDRPDALQRLDQYRCPPSIVIASGGSPGHAHAYWQLQQPVDLDELEQANRRLAIRLGGDLASVDAARILRPPTSMELETHPADARRAARPRAARRYQLAELTAGLADPSPRRSVDRLAPAAPRPASSTNCSSRFPPPPTCQRSPAASPTAPAKSAARSTTTAPPASSSTTTAGTASPAASEAPSTTSGRASTASTPAATNSYSSASASPTNSTSLLRPPRLCTTPRPSGTGQLQGRAYRQPVHPDEAHDGEGRNRRSHASLASQRGACSTPRRQLTRRARRVLAKPQKRKPRSGFPSGDNAGADRDRVDDPRRGCPIRPSSSDVTT